jgi:L-lactate dehydrogenase (cytochrome)
MKARNPTARHLARCHSIRDLRRVAKRRLPRAVFDYVDGGAEDETTLRRNVTDFEGYDLVPRALIDVAEVDLVTSLLGQPIDFPVILAPTGLTRLVHHVGEVAAARAAARAGTIYSLSALASTSIEALADAAAGPKWFQIYVWKDRDLVKEFFERCRVAGYQALCLTVDVPGLGQRERDLRNGMTIPPRITVRTVLDASRRPRWWWSFLRSPRITMANVVGRGEAGRTDVTALGTYVNRQFDPSVTWDDVARMIEQWNGPFAIKGILRAEDALRAIELGVRAIVVSNHGGRQLDHAASAIDVLPEIVDAVGNRAEVILDGGVRRGTDVVKALALGARACMIGRAYLYGLGAGGEQGVDRSLELLRNEIRRTMVLLGCPSLAELSRCYIRRRHAPLDRPD